MGCKTLVPNVPSVLTCNLLGYSLSVACSDLTCNAEAIGQWADQVSSHDGEAGSAVDVSISCWAGLSELCSKPLKLNQVKTS